MKHIYIYALACAATWAQCGPGLHLISINGRDYICASIDQTGAGVPTNPCSAARQFYVDQTNSNIYWCASSGTNWIGPLGTGNAGTVTHTAGALTSTAIVAGNGGADIKTPNTSTTLDAATGNIATPGSVSTGTGGGVNGQVCLNGSTSGQACVTVPSGAGTPQALLLPTTTPLLNQTLVATGVTGSTQLGWSSSTGVTCDQFDLTKVCLPFDASTISSGNTTNNTGVGMGATAFFWINSSGSVDTFSAVGSGTVPTGIQLNSNATLNGYIGVMLGPQISGSTNKILPSSFLGTSATMDFKFTTKLGTFAGVAGDNEKFFFGCTDGFPTNTNAFGVEYISGTDTQWTAVSINGGTATRTNIAAGDTNRHNLEVKKTTTANSVQMCVDATCATAITTNIPTAALNCGLAIQGTTTTTVTAVMYKGFFLLTGLTNP